MLTINENNAFQSLSIISSNPFKFGICISFFLKNSSSWLKLLTLLSYFYELSNECIWTLPG